MTWSKDGSQLDKKDELTRAIEDIKEYWPAHRRRFMRAQATEQHSEAPNGFREITVAEANIASERIEQFQRFLDVAISDDRIDDLVPGGELRFRAITVKGNPYQLTAFRPEQRPDLPWRVRITLGDLEWDRARELDVDSGSFADVDDAFDLVERRLRDAMTAKNALMTV